MSHAAPHAAPHVTPDSRMASLVAQHARTASLMGVDFVPAYRAAGPTTPRPADAGTAPGAMVEPKASRDPGAEAAGPSVTLDSVEGERPQIHVRAGVVPSRVHVNQGRAAGAHATGGHATGDRDRASVRARLDELRARYERDAPHAPFISEFTNIVFGEGDPCARLMFVGEAPGEQEDLTGRPFVGKAGNLLGKMIHAMGLEREGVYIANVLKVRPPNNATPTLEEAAASAPYLFEQIDIIAPEAIVTLGLPASRAILNSTASMGQMRGLWATFTTPSGRQVAVMPTYHPAFLLRSYTTENRAKVWSDLLKVVERLGLTVRPVPKDG